MGIKFSKNKSNKDKSIDFNLKYDYAFLNAMKFYLEKVTKQQEIKKRLMLHESLNIDKGIIFYINPGENTEICINPRFPFDFIFLKENIITKIHHYVPNIDINTKSYLINVNINTADRVIKINGGLSRDLGLKKGDYVLFY
tara:strand:- start:800 stop:1222 length:423 start_codon:yes stop_codon:yes gene_type:complete